MHPILEIAFGVALGMTIFLVIVWILGMCVYICCNKNDCIASCNKSKRFKGNKEQKVYTPDEVKETTDEVKETTDEVSLKQEE